MTASERIGILLFLHNRNELSDSEQTELANWRREDPANEQLFRETSDPDFVRKTLREYYRNRDELFGKLTSRFPYLKDAKLSGEAGYDDDDQADENYQEVFPEKQLSESGLSKPEFWRSMIPELMLTGDAKADEEGQHLPEQGKVVRIKKRRRRLSRILWVAAGLVITAGILYLFPDSDIDKNIRQTVYISVDGFKTVISSDYDRGKMARKAGITFEFPDTGEMIWIFPNHPEKRHKDNFTLASGGKVGMILRLPDHTMIWGSTLTSVNLPANFSQDTITINMEGEAFFKLPDHSGHHYLIGSKVKNQGLIITVQDQGPQLSMSSYENDSVVRVTLVSGTANILNSVSHDSIALQPGQQVILNNGIAIAEVKGVADISQFISQKNGVFNFKDLPIQDIMPTLEHWYEVSVKYQGQANNRKFTLQVPRSTKLSKVLRILEKQGLQVTREGRKLTITF